MKAILRKKKKPLGTYVIVYIVLYLGKYEKSSENYPLESIESFLEFMGKNVQRVYEIFLIKDLFAQARTSLQFSSFRAQS